MEKIKKIGKYSKETIKALDGEGNICYYYRVAKSGCRGVAQFGSAPGLGPGGRRFESFHLDHFLI